MEDSKKLDLYKKWFDNYSFFSCNTFVIEEIKFLWDITNIIGLNFEYCTKTTHGFLSEAALEESVKLAQRYFDSHNIDINVNKEIENGNLYFIPIDKNNNSVTDGYSNFDKEQNKIIAYVQYRNITYDSLVIIHELSHSSNQPNGGRGSVSEIFTEALAYTNELIACDELFDEDNKKAYFQIFQRTAYYNYACKIFNIYKVILTYKNQKDITEEKYNLEFDDNHYNEVMEDFENYTNNHELIFVDSYYIFGFALTIYMFMEYKKDKNFFNKITELNDSINNKDFKQCLNIVGIASLDDLTDKLDTSIKQFVKYVNSYYDAKVKSM